MTARLPTVGADDGSWGTVLNDYLSAEHGADGTHSKAFSSNLTFATDNANDIGATASGRPRDVFVGRNMTVAGTTQLGGGYTIPQSSDTTANINVFTLTPPTRAPWQQYSFTGGPQLDGSYEHVMAMGWNSQVFQSGPGVATGEPALIMAFEDGFYDTNAATGHKEGMEWWVGYYSPDHTSVALFRPFYARIQRNNNTDHSAGIYMDIGTDGTGALAVTAGAFGPALFTVIPTQIQCLQNLTLGSATPQLFFNNSLGGVGYYIQASSVNQLIVSDKGGTPVMVLGYGTTVANSLTDIRTSVKIGGSVGFFGHAVATQPTKAGHNNWASISDVTSALASLGLIDTA